MTIKSAPYYWVECDEPGCGRKSGDDREYSAWDDAGTALDDVLGYDWSEAGGKHFCDDHARYECDHETCTTLIDRKQAIEHDDLCDEHWAATEAGWAEEADR